MRLEHWIEEYSALLPEGDLAGKVEVRLDPLTGSLARINRARSSRPRQDAAPPALPPPQGCPFCPENIESETPRFHPDFYPEGRIRRGHAVLFPNMFPLASAHGVSVFTPEHKLDIRAFTPDEIRDGLLSAASFAETASRRGMAFHFLGWNHLSQSGASMLHPHFQVLAGRRPVSSLAMCQALCEEYLRKEGKPFWEDLLESESGSPRFVGRTGSFAWLAPWSPAGSCEVIGVHTGSVTSIPQLGEEEARHLAEGVCKSLKGICSMGRKAVTMAVYSLPASAPSKSFSLHVRLMARSQRPVCDRAFLELYAGEVGLAEAPEEYAAVLRAFF